MVTIRNNCIVLLFFILFLPENSFAAPPGYNYYKLLTTQENQITAGTGNLFDFPVLVRLTDNDLRHTSNGGYVEHISGYDIIFTSSDGNTIIPHQVEEYNPVTGELVAWVKVPIVSSIVNTNFYMYFGDPTATVDPSTNTTWNSSYVGVWHLHNDLLDATANAINLTNVGPTLNEPNAVAAAGQDVDLAQALTHPTNPLLQITGDITLETWINFESALQGGGAGASENMIFAEGLNSEAAGTNYCFSLNYIGTGVAINRLRFYWEYGPGTDYSAVSTVAAPPGIGIWHHVAAVRNSASLEVRFFFDGVELGTPVTVPSMPTSSGSTTFSIGRDIATPARDVDADFDEARISNTTRDPEWIQATYQNTMPGSTFLVITETRCVFSDFALAGSDQNVCVNSATLNGNALTYGSGSWSVLTGGATIVSPTSPTSVVTGLSVGSNKFIWTVTNSPFPPCESFKDTVEIIFDNTPPAVTCPPAQNVFASATCTFTIPNYIALSTITDNCGPGGLTITQTPAAGTVVSLGTTNVTITVTDVNGNTANCTFPVNVQDNTAPVFTSCPTNITVFNNPGSCGAVVSWPNPVATDNCSGVSVSQTLGLPSGSTFTIGTTNIQFTATDPSGNIALCAFTVTVIDAETPVFTFCPSSVVLPNDPGQCTAVASWAAPTATDNCPGLVVVQTAGLPSGSAFPTGVTINTFSATDVNGNTTTCSFNVTVNETQSPVFATCPLNITVPASAGTCSANVSWVAPTATDNCPGLVITQTAGPVSGSSFGIGTTTISYTATDITGNTATCSFTVTVNDNQPPVFSFCPGNISVVNTPGSCGAVVTWVAPSATDNCAGVTITQTAGLTSGSFFPIGVTNIQFTATDGSGNTTTCSFLITVTDGETPVFTSCPSNITVSTSPGMCNVPVTWVNPTATDNCPGVTITQSSGLFNGSSFPVGVNTVSYTATDAVGNSTTCTFTITVNDNESPSFTTCPSNITVNNTPGTCGAVVSWIAPTVSENCAGLTLTQTSGLPSGSTFPVGTTTVTFVANDAAGNTSTCSFVVTVIDNQPPVFTSCPGNITVTNTPGTCGAIVTWLAPVANDNCPGTVLTQTAGLSSGSTFPIGVSTISYTATDANGLTSVCSFTVTVTDGEPPVFSSCPTNITLNNNPGVCGAFVTWAAPVANDNCPGVVVSQISGLPSGSVFPIGTTSVSFNATDANGNTLLCSFTVTVTDNEFPVFTSCPSNINVNSNPGSCSSVVTWVAPTASDNCAGLVINQISGLPSGSAFPLGTTTVTYTATDASSNISTCSFTVTVVDNQVPVFTSCPSNISVNNNSGSCSATVSWPLPVVSDNCSGVTMVQTSGLASGAAYPVGVTTNTFTAADASGNTSTCTFTVTVIDNEAPAFISCPTNIITNNNPGLCSAIVTWPAPTANDNCTGVSIVQTTGLTSGSAFPIGTTNISFTATDANGNTSVCSFTVTVIDNQVPTILSCPSNIIVNNTPGLCSAVVNWISPTSSDNCTGASITQTAGLPSGSTFPLGVTNISYTATDASGNSSVCSFSVTVIDNQPPTFVSCPSNIVVNSAFGSCNAIVSWPAPVASDNCTGVSLLQTAGPISGSSFPIGVTTIAYTATDGTGNTNACTFTVTVTDNQLPVFTSCPTNITVPSNPGLCSAVVSWVNPVATDNCVGLTMIQTAGLPSGSTFPIGTTPISFTATDASGNSSICSFTVTVTDNQPPIFTSCPSNISVNNTPGNCSAVVTWAAPVITDNCTGASFVQTAGLPSGSTFPIGTTTIAYTATDAGGNTSTCSFTVTVTDNQAPTFTSCPINITTNNNPGVCGAIVNWVSPSATDNCAGVTVLQTLGLPSGSLFPIGTTNISYTATDAYGNISVCAFSVTVNDLENPVFTSCPANIITNVTPGLCNSIVNWTTPSATDNCSGVVVTQTAGLPSGSAFPIGISTITYTATDNYGNTSTCSFTITVIDNQIPVFVSCPSNISVNTTPGLCSAVVSWVSPFATDNCAGLTVTQTSGLPSGSSFPIGVTTISYNATDASGNTAVCTFTVTVSDNLAPTFTFCPSPIVTNNTPGTCSAIVTWPAPTATDNCAGLVITQTAGLPSGSAFPIGTSTVTYTAIDASGNTSSCTFTVTVSDNQVPVFTSCPSSISVNNNAGLCGANVTWSAPIVTDNCAGVTLTQTSGLPSGSLFPIGSTNVSYLAVDASGNTATCSFTVTVSDNESPIFTSCPVNIITNTTPGSCNASVSWATPTATDNCPGVSVIQTSGLVSGSSFPIGISTITYNASDGYGNSTTCSFTITVIDNQFPVFTSCPTNITVTNNPGMCSANVSWTAPSATDNCPGLILTQTSGLPSGSAFPIGVTTINYTATDANGNTSNCSFTITVSDNENPSFSSCPVNINVNNTPGTCGAIVFWAPPIATDNCAGLIINQTSGLPSGSNFPIGITTNTFTATDAYGNTSTCTFTVTVNDNQLPVFTSCPVNVNVNNTPGVCGAVVSWAAPTATDNCPGLTIAQTSGLPSGSTFPVGTTLVTFVAADASGNTATCSFSVTVNDVQSPVFTSCPSNITVNNTPGSCFTTVSWVAPTATDNCSGLVVSQTAGLVSGSNFPIGSTTVTFTALDASGNTSLCSFVVTVVDNQLPVFTSCPINITVNNTPGSCFANVSWVAPTATDNCSGLVVSQTAGLSSGAAFPIGVSTISYTATDASGNTATCSFTVTVIDNQVPVFTSCPTNIVLNNNPSLCSAIASWTLPTATDNCGGLTITQTSGLPNGSAFPIGVTTVTYLATDASGNTASCSFTITVIDNQFPVFVSCPLNITTNATPGACSAVVTWTSPSATDNCAGLSLIQTSGPVSGSTFPLGVTTITYSATDASGNVTNCSFSVTVNDNQPPTFTSCPVNINLTTSSGSCTAIASWAPPTATDNCGGSVSIVQTAGLPTGSAFPLGVTLVNFTATDASGNSSVCSFTVTVSDNQPPVFTSCPSNITVNNSPGLCGANVSWVVPGATDNCSGVVVTQTAGLPSGSFFPLGVTTITYSALDAGGNSVTCTFTVTVNDNEIPSFTSCPSNITVNNNPGLCSAIVSWIAPSATDNCAGLSIVQTAGLPTGSAFPIGVTTVSYTATDAAGNSSSCSFTVTVVDNQFPTFTSCPANITSNNDPGLCSAVVTWIAPVATDNCAGMTLVQTGGFASGSAFPVGVSTITYTATDAAGNSTNCSFTITVNDNQAPVFSSCPSTINVNAGIGICSQTVSWSAPVANDNCGGIVTIVQTAGLPSGSSFPIGTTNISYNAIDATGNISVCSFNVVVTDNQLPLFTSCPSSIVLNSTPGLCSAVATWIAPTATDNCAGVTVTQTSGLPSGSVFPVGVTTISYNASDASGNTSTCTFTVTVNDNQAPIFTSCPTSLSLINNSGLCGAIASWPAPTVSDNCTGAIISQTAGLPSGSLFPVGTTVVTFVATDGGGNTATCSFNVVVTDNENPTFVSCPSNITLNSSAGTCSAFVSWTAPVASDNCPGVTLTQTAGPANGSLFPLGITTISYTATDATGNSSICSFTVTVIDAEAPTFTLCPSNITVSNTVGSCGATVTWAAPTATDNCAGAVTISQVSGLPSGSFFPVGTTTISYFATDVAGNTSNCSFTVTVQDNELPVFTSCPVNITLNNNPGLCSAVASWILPTVSDNCPGVTMVQTSGLPNGSAFPVGTSTITYQATDAAGNISLCSFTITVIDNQLPTFISCPLNIVTTNTAGLCSAVVTWPAPAANDNCPGTVVTLTGGLPSGSAFPVGTTTVIFTATDASGNSSVCSFTVTVNDVQPPTFASCPSNIIVNNDPGNCSAIVNWVLPSAIDNCSGVTVTQTSGLPNGSVFPLGTTTIAYTATDASGLTASCSFTVTVTDNEAPVFTSCPSNITVNNTPGLCSGVASWVPPVANDNCSGLVTITQTTGLPSGSTFPIGTTVITYTASDVLGNTSVCTFSVTVNDVQLPVFASCPSNISVPNTAGTCGTVVNWIAPTASDNCPGVLVTQTAGLPNGSVFPIGTTTITYSANDAAGNVSLCSFTITVTDVQAPVFTSCPINVVVNNNPGICGAAVTWAAPTANDNCPGTTITQTSGLVSGSIFPIGTTNVSFTATDASGNTAVCSFTVTVNDVEVPVFTICPSNINVNNSIGSCGTNVSWVAPSANDNCAGTTIVQTAGPVSGSFFPIGTTTITYTATDASGNTNTCLFTVTVNDAELPAFTSCPSNITVNNDIGSCDAVVNWINPVATDNCAGVTLVQSAGLPNGSAFPIGVTTITYTATDAAGNSNVCSFTVTVSDNELPVFTSCPATITVNNTVGICGENVTWIAPVANDNCPGVSIVQSSGLPSGSLFPIGTNTVSYTATDAAGNTSTCSFNINVIDNELPVFTSCPSNITLVNDLGVCGAVVNWAAPVAADNCAGVIVSQTSGLANGSVFPIGTTTVSYLATDASGNASNCSFTVTVNDTELPVFTSCPADIASCNPVVTFSLPIANDNCAGVVVTQTSGLPSGSTFPLGNTLNTFTATDASGNVQLCQFNVTIAPPVTSLFTSAAPDTMCVLESDINLISIVAPNPSSTDSFSISLGGVIPSTWLFSPSSSGVGSYTITHYVTNGVCSDTSMHTILVVPVSNASWIAADTICESSGSITLTPTGDPGGNWIGPGITGNIFDPTIAGAGIHNISYVVGFGICKDTATRTIYVSPDVDPSWAFTNSSICTSSGMILLDTLVSGTAGGTWSGPGVTGNLFDPSSLTGLINITYTVGESFCAESLTQSINVIVLPMTYAGNDTAVCGLTDTLNALPLIGNGQWSSPSPSISFSNILDPNAVVSSSAQGTYALIWSESVGGTCFASDTVYVTFWEIPTANAGVDQSIDVSYSVLAATTPTFGTGSWTSQNTGPIISLPNNPNTAVTNLTVGDNTFTWTVVNGSCPPVTDEVIITVNDVILPEGISPNGDGLNDVWVIGGISSLKNELTIFNRWGEEVYSVTNYQNDWAGTKSNGTELPSDTYFFILKVEGYEDFTGYIIINR